MTLRELGYLLRSDLFRYYGRSGKGLFLKSLITNFATRYTLLLRTCSYLRQRRVWWPVYCLAYWLLLHCMYKYGIQISPRTTIGPGFCIGHFGGIVVSHRATIGRNCNLSHQVTIGASGRGDRAGVPTIGDNVYIGPGAKIFGAITIGNNVAIGANAVVTRDVPDNAVVVGVPAKVISMEGSKGLIARTDYGDGSA